MKKIILTITILFTSSVFSQGFAGGVMGTLPEICRSLNQADKQIICMQKMIKCLKLDTMVRTVPQKQIAICVLKLDPEQFKNK
jgi:hypothetical protein